MDRDFTCDLTLVLEQTGFGFWGDVREIRSSVYALTEISTFSRCVYNRNRMLAIRLHPQLGPPGLTLYVDIVSFGLRISSSVHDIGPTVRKVRSSECSGSFQH